MNRESQVQYDHVLDVNRPHDQMARQVIMIFGYLVDSDETHPSLAAMGLSSLMKAILQ